MTTNFHLLIPAYFPSANGTYYVTQSTDDGITPLMEVKALIPPTPLPPGYGFPYGIFSFKVSLPQNKAGMVLELNYHGGPVPDSYYNFHAPVKTEENGQPESF